MNTAARVTGASASWLRVTCSDQHHTNSNHGRLSAANVAATCHSPLVLCCCKRVPGLPGAAVLNVMPHSDCVCCCQLQGGQYELTLHVPVVLTAAGMQPSLTLVRKFAVVLRGMK